jgi:hypothetical protein
VVQSAGACADMILRETQRPVSMERNGSLAS